MARDPRAKWGSLPCRQSTAALWKWGGSRAQPAAARDSSAQRVRAASVHMVRERNKCGRVHRDTGRSRRHQADSRSGLRRGHPHSRVRSERAGALPGSGAHDPGLTLRKRTDDRHPEAGFPDPCTRDHAEAAPRGLTHPSPMASR